MVRFFHNGYNHTGEISLVKVKCDVCQQEKICLSVDNSEGEYYDGRICKDCIDKLFADVNIYAINILSDKVGLPLPEKIYTEEEKRLQKLAYEYCMNIN